MIENIRMNRKIENLRFSLEKSTINRQNRRKYNHEYQFESRKIRDPHVEPE